VALAFVHLLERLTHSLCLPQSHLIAFLVGKKEEEE